MTLSDDGEAAEDWTGQEFSCQDCLHQKLRDGGRCVLGRICVRDKRARRIDGFFAKNPEYAGDYIDHLYSRCGRWRRNTPIPSRSRG